MSSYMYAFRSPKRLCIHFNSDIRTLFTTQAKKMHSTSQFVRH